ncbi:MAG TPA: hypothetical protein GXZ23_03570 [Clostridiales bacterium]|nr:hypothetical protein [Clostridiales bacterium]
MMRRSIMMSHDIIAPEFCERFNAPDLTAEQKRMKFSRSCLMRITDTTTFLTT